MVRKDLSKFNDEIVEVIPLAKRKQIKFSFKVLGIILGIYITLGIVMSLYFAFMYPQTHKGVAQERIVLFIFLWCVTIVVLLLISIFSYIKNIKWNNSHLELVPIELINQTNFRINDGIKPMYVKFSMINNIYKEKNDCIGFFLKDGTTIHASAIEDVESTYIQISEYVNNSQKKVEDESLFK